MEQNHDSTEIYDIVDAEYNDDDAEWNFKVGRNIGLDAEEIHRIEEITDGTPWIFGPVGVQSVNVLMVDDEPYVERIEGRKYTIHFHEIDEDWVQRIQQSDCWWLFDD